MPDRTQDLKNHRKVAVACKNYTDKEVKKAKDELITLFSKNTVETDDHTSELAYQITAPSGAKLLQLQAIGGNTVKYSPSVASDSTKAMIKTMPSTVYTFDGSKFYGDSEVSENLIVLQEKNYTESNINIKSQNGIITIVGTASETKTLVMYFDITNISLNGDYYWTSFLSFNGNFNLQNSSSTIIGNGWGTAGKTENLSNTSADRININLGITSGNSYNLTIKPMLVKGSTAPTTFVQGFDGIHNLELSGLKVEGSNLAGFDDVVETTINGVKVKYKDGAVYLDGTANAQFKIVAQFKQPIYANQDYYVKLFTSGTTTATNPKAIGETSSDVRLLIPSTTTFNVDYDINYFWFSAGNGTVWTNYAVKPMIVRGSTAPTTFVQYVAPTTKTIDLSTILYNGNPLFEGNSLKGVDTIKDSITPYKATKRIGAIQIKDLTNGSIITDERFKFSVPNIKIANIRTVKLLVAGYETKSNSETYDINWNMVVYNTGNEASVVFANNSYTTVADFVAGEGNKYLLFELETPIEVSIDWASTLRNIQGYPNGSIIAENTHNKEVESVITYNSIIQETLCPSVTVDGANRFVGTWERQTNVQIISSTNESIIVNRTQISNSFAYKTISLKAGTYTLSFNSNGYCTYQISTESVVLSITGNVSKTFTISEDTQVIFNFTTANNNTQISITNIMLNEGSTALSYRPYKAPITRNLPTQASDGYSAGTQRNYRVFCDDEGNEVSKRENNVNKEDLGNIDYIHSTSIFRGSLSTIKIIGGNDTPNMLSKNYTTDTPNNVYNRVSDKTIASSTTTTQVWVNDTFYTDTTIFKTANVGNPLYYELADASKTETDMDDFDYFFDVEEGDVITFNNTYAQQVYATYSFLIKEAKSNE